MLVAPARYPTLARLLLWWVVILCKEEASQAQTSEFGPDQELELSELTVLEKGTLDFLTQKSLLT